MSSFRRQVLLNPHVRQHCPPAQNFNSAEEFHRQLPHYKPTALLSLSDIAKECGVGHVILKDESERMELPSFKVLGASWAIFQAITSKLHLPLSTSLHELAASAKQEKIELFTATDGNHGRAVAYMAKLLSIPCHVYVPSTLDDHARSAIWNEEATIVQSSTYNEAMQEAAMATKGTNSGILVQDTGFAGYEEIPEQIVQGYSTMLREIDDQIRGQFSGVDLVICPVGVGSLAQAVTQHFKSQSRPVKVVTVEPDTAACFYQSLQQMQPVTIKTSPTIMTGMECGTVSSIAWPHLKETVDASLSVSDFEAHLAVQDLARRNISAGPCGAAGLASLRILAANHRNDLGLNDESVILLLNTEGARSYTVPYDVAIEDPVTLTQTLTRIESTNPSLSTSKGTGETVIANYIEAWLQHRNIETDRVEMTRGRPSVVGVVRGLEDRKSLMVNGHMDTVSLSNYGSDPLSGALQRKGDRDVIVGRGCLDMKAGLAAGMVAVAHASQVDTIGTVILAAVADEEDASKGTQDILAAGWRADGAIIPEPTGFVMATAHRGFIWVEIEIRGFAAHGSQADLGVDAIAEAGQFLVALQEYGKTLPEDKLLGKASLHCGQIKGGEEPSTYPATCTLTVEFRTVPAQTPDAIIKDLKDILRGISKRDEQFEYAEPRILLQRPPHSVSPEQPFVRAAIAASEIAVGRHIEPEGIRPWTDAALLGEKGIPAVVWGPLGEGLHGDFEWVDVESIRTTEKMLIHLIKDFCSSKLHP